MDMVIGVINWKVLVTMASCVKGIHNMSVEEFNLKSFLLFNLTFYDSWNWLIFQLSNVHIA
jgi:hypothetical protein